MCQSNFLAFQLKSAIAKTRSFSHQKQISPVVFYGSPLGVPPKKPTRLWRLLHEIRLDLSRQNKSNLRYLSDAGSTLYCFHLFILFALDVSDYDLNAATFLSRKEVWITFPRQDEAMKFAKGQEDVHLFSYQDHFNGQRRFLVSTYTEFWRRFPSDIFLSHVNHHLLLIVGDKDRCFYIFILLMAVLSQVQKHGFQIPSSL